MARSTPATIELTRAKVAFTVHTYDYDPAADSIGLQAAEALGEAPARVLKSLMAKVDGNPVCVVLPSDRTVNMKKLAAVCHGKSAEMMAPADAERMSGYKVGGISPFGQKRKVRTVMEEAAMGEALVYINGGQRGLQVRLSPTDARAVLEAMAAAVSN